LQLISIAYCQESRVDDKTDLAKFIAPVRDRMIATVWRILRHPQDAEDALQNALVTVWRKRTQVESHPTPHALILRICADAAIDHFRRRRLNHVDVSLLEEGLPAPDLSPLDGLIKDETLDLVMDAIAGLSPKQSVAIVMKYILAESHATIAEALCCSTETVREHLARGRERLAPLLGHLVPDRLPTKITTPFPQENER
jgi:RNA polymerase sigma-70 factor (ECF subfamily)